MFNWTDAYQEFIDIANSVDVDSKMPTNIETKVENLYAQHKGDPVWDEAYRRWREE